MAVEVAQDVLPRAAGAAAAVRDAWDAYQARLEARDGLIVRAVDEGLSQGSVARACGLSKQAITKILAHSQS